MASAITITTALEQSDTATGGGGGGAPAVGGAGGGGVSVGQVSRYRPGDVPPNVSFLRVPFTIEATLNNLQVQAESAPNNDYDVELFAAGSVVETVTLPAGSTETTVEFEHNVSPLDFVEVTGQPTVDSGLSGVSVAIKVTA